MRSESGEGMCQSRRPARKGANASRRRYAPGPMPTTDASLVTEYELQGAVRSADRGVLLAHGAGSNMHGATLDIVASALSTAGIPVLRFNYPYRTRGRKAPDRPPVLEAATREAAAE